MFQLQTLGSVELRGLDGRSVQSVLAQPRRTALLLYLAAATPRGFHRRDTLLALLWPESDTDRGRAALSQAVYFLRRSLRDTLVVSRGSEELAVDPEQLDCDLVRFGESLRAGRLGEALSLYQGDFLEGFHISDAPEFERWVDRERERLRETAVRAAWDLVRQAEERRDADAALEWGYRALQIAREDESAVRGVMSLLDRFGERSRALLLYDDFARRLGEELGLEPAPETLALASSLRAERAVRATAALPKAGPPMPPDSPARPRPADPPERRQDAPPGKRPRGRLRAMLAGAAAALALVSALSSTLGGPENPEPVRSRVVVAGLENRTGDRSLDVLGAMAADWITAGLQETGLLEVVDPVTAFVSTRNVAADSAGLLGHARAGALARETGAGMVVWGSYYRTGDSLHFNVSISEARSAMQTQRIAVSGPADHRDGVVRELRQRVAGALAGGLDNRIATLSTSTSAPPRLDAYLEYSEGLELFTRNEYAAAYPRLLRAADLDSTFILPRFWALFALGNVRDYARRDSLLSTILPLRERLAPLDRYSLDFFLADSRRDQVEALRAVRHAARLAPQSNWTYMVGLLSLRLNRPRESLAALEQLDPERGWARGWNAYWSVRMSARHQLGMHAEELADARRARSTDSADPERIGAQIWALAALGRVREVRALLDTLVTLPQAAAGVTRSSVEEMISRASDELRAHGSAAAAEDLLRWDLARLERLPPKERSTQPNRVRHANLLARLGRLAEAEGEARQCMDAYPDDIGCVSLFGALVARKGDRAEADRRSRQVQEMAERSPYLVTWALVRRAVIAAQLGDSTRAVDLIEQSIRRGTGTINLLHSDHGLEPLRSYPPFQDLIRPKG